MNILKSPVLIILALPLCEIHAQQLLYDDGEPDDFEQLAMELVNRARADPLAEAQRYDLADLNDGLEPGTITSAPKQPIAFHPAFLQAAREHTGYLFESNTFSNTGKDGSTHITRLSDAGYPIFPDALVCEAISRILDQEFLDPEDRVQRHHRISFLNKSGRKDILQAEFDEGATVLSHGSFTIEGTTYGGTSLLSLNFSSSPYSPDPESPFLTGVVYADVDENGMYSPGEGIAGVEIRPVYGNWYTVSGLSGGYALPVMPGYVYLTLKLNGLGFDDERVTLRMPGDRNHKADFQPCFPEHPDPWSEAPAYPGNWFGSEWFGWFCRMPDNWIFHLEHGYQYCVAAGGCTVFLYDLPMDRWVYTSEGLYPNLYLFGEKAGWYWYYEGGQRGNRWFVSLETSIAYPEADLRENTLPTPEANLVLVNGGSLPALSEIGPIDVSSFYLEKYEVTWGPWKDVRDWAVSHGYDLAGVADGCADDHPVHRLSWYSAVKWCNARSEKDGLTPAYTVDGSVYRSGQLIPDWNHDANGYRLPTSAEWEFAARGGNESHGYPYSGSETIDDVAWYMDNSTQPECKLFLSRGTWPAGQKLPNELGLYDMSGNASEMVWDHTGDTHSFSHRGGSFFSTTRFAAISHIYHMPATLDDIGKGFRVARSGPRD